MDQCNEPGKESEHEESKKLLKTPKQAGALMEDDLYIFLGASHAGVSPDISAMGAF